MDTKETTIARIYPTRADLDLRAMIQEALIIARSMADWALRHEVAQRLGWVPRAGWFSRELSWLSNAKIIRLRVGFSDGVPKLTWSLAPPRSCAMKINVDGEAHFVH